MTSKSFRFFIWTALLLAGFFAGVAWKTQDAAVPEPEAATTTSEAREAKPLSADPAVVENSRMPEERQGLTPEELANIHIFESATPSVCFITTSNVRRDYWSRNITEIPRGTGSGFVWNKEGHIVTNFHVIQGADKAQVTLADRTTWDATLVGSAPEKDLAVLRIDAPRRQLRPIPVGMSDDLRVGQVVYAIGNPFGLDQTLTKGIVSALGREIESVAGIPIRDVIQTDAAINPGNSGGPLLDSSGRLIGVNTAIYSPSGASAGIGFSIPVDVVSWVVPELIAYGELKRPSMGVDLVRPQIVIRLVNEGALPTEGALIYGINQNSAADRAGLRPTSRDRYGNLILGDLIVAFNGEKITSNNDLILALEKYQPGERVTLTVLREGQQRELEVILDPPK